jgi:hypothetical protein
VADAKSTKTSDRKLSGAAARAVEKKLAEGAKPMAQGIGESRRFGGGGQPRDLAGCTVNGDPLPPECWDTFPYSLTDQGKAEARELQKSLPVGYQGRDRTEYNRIFDPDKKIAKFADDRQIPADDLEGLVIVRDPLQPLLERHTPPGHRGMFLSKRKCQQEGLIRGVLEYQPVMIKGEDGTMQRVECGGMFLASVPEELAVKSDRYWRSLNEDKKVQTIEKVRNQVEEVMNDRKLGDFARRRGISDALVGMEVEDQERGDAELLREALAHE